LSWLWIFCISVWYFELEHWMHKSFRTIMLSFLSRVWPSYMSRLCFDRSQSA
jgi:hypothetical protein